MTDSKQPVAGNGKRRKIMLVLTAVIAVCAAAYTAYWALVSRHLESTDDAYVSGNVVQITPQIAGTVVAIRADDTDFVKIGEPLITLDQADAKVALDQAEAQLAQVVREVRTLFVGNQSLAANVAVRDAELAKAEEDLRRRQGLVASGAVSKEEINHAETAVKSAKAALLAAREQLATNRALTDNTTLDQHPNVQRASARVREAYLAYQRTTIPAPVSGYVAKRNVQVGQRVQPGAPLMAVIPLDQVWVDANFKEVQLRRMRIGQPVTLIADLYGGRVVYDGKVVGLSAGTGGAFALLPAQNATGNWIKVVQRVPVRISLDRQQLNEHPLRIGLSMQAEVDVSDQSGSQLSAVSRNDAVYQTSVYEEQDKSAEALVHSIIAGNAGYVPKNIMPAAAKTPGRGPSKKSIKLIESRS